MSFALTVKKEVLSQEFSHEEALAFIDGIVASSSTSNMNETTIKINNAEISDSIKDMMDQLSIPWDDTYENKNWIIIEEWKKQTKIKQPGFYFAGVFLGGGSISAPESTSYHLEIQMYSHMNAKSIQTFLNKYDFDFVLIQRRQLWVLYLKKADQISDFLKAIRAIRSLLEFEDAKIIRGFKNEIVKYSNLEVHNQKKLAKSWAEFNEQFEFVKKNGLIDSFREQEIIFFEIKQNNPYKSLNEIVEIYNKKTNGNKTKPGLSHYLIKLRKIINSEQ